MTQQQQTVTIEDMRELLTSGYMDPTLVRWNDTGELEVVSGIDVYDGTYYGGTGEATATVIVSRAAVEGGCLGDYDVDAPTADDFAAMAEVLNDPR
jgi:hypothetical protein